MEQRPTQTDTVAPQAGRRHSEPIRSFERNQWIPYRDVLGQGDVIMGLPTDIYGKAGRLQIFVASELVEAVLSTVGTTLRPGGAGAVATAGLATPYPAQRLNFWRRLMVWRHMPIQRYPAATI